MLGRGSHTPGPPGLSRESWALRARLPAGPPLHSPSWGREGQSSSGCPMPNRPTCSLGPRAPPNPRSLSLGSLLLPAPALRSPESSAGGGRRSPEDSQRPGRPPAFIPRGPAPEAGPRCAPGGHRPRCCPVLLRQVPGSGLQLTSTPRQPPPHFPLLLPGRAERARQGNPPNLGAAPHLAG